jgi:hypothetical protein
MKSIENFEKQEFSKEIAKEDLSQICGGHADTLVNVLR